MPDDAFKNEPVLATTADLASWRVDWDGDAAVGPCPHCTHQTKSVLDRDVVALGERDESQTTVMTRKFSCACGQKHMDGSTQFNKCGRWWYVTITKTSSEVTIAPAADTSIFPAADALAKEAEQQDALLRASAEKWIAGVTALLGLFGLAGLVVNKDTLRALPDAYLIAAAVLLGLALMSAVMAIIKSYKAAYGWPRVVDVSDDAKLASWFKDRRARLGVAASALQNGVKFSIGAISLLFACVGVIIFAPSASAKPLVAVTTENSAGECGELLSSTQGNGLRIQRTDGSITVIPWSTITKIDLVDDCKI